MRILLIATLVLFCSFVAYGQMLPSEFEQLIVFQDTKASVNSKFDEVRTHLGSSTYSYQTAFGEVSVSFVDKSCEYTTYGKWNVPAETVVSVRFSPTGSILPKEIGINLKKYKKEEISDVPGAFIYANETKGLEFSIRKDDSIESIEKTPRKIHEKLRCK